MDCHGFASQCPSHPNLPNQTTDWTLAHPSYIIRSSPSLGGWWSPIQYLQSQTLLTLKAALWLPWTGGPLINPTATVSRHYLWTWVKKLGRSMQVHYPHLGSSSWPVTHCHFHLPSPREADPQLHATGADLEHCETTAAASREAMRSKFVQLLREVNGSKGSWMLMVNPELAWYPAFSEMCILLFRATQTLLDRTTFLKGCVVDKWCSDVPFCLVFMVGCIWEQLNTWTIQSLMFLIGLVIFRRT